MTSKLYLIPSPLGDVPPQAVIPEATLSKIKEIGIFVVEELRTARRYLSAAGLKGHIDELEFHLLNEHSTPEDAKALLSLFKRGDVGMISEAGLPAVADPGAALVSLCHKNGIEVVPLVGPSSLLMALMASGLNGQNFAFRGYLPAKSEERKAAIKREEKLSHSEHSTQIFIETPYRNDSLLKDMLDTLSPSTMLCIAADITLSSETIRSASVAEWRKSNFVIGKRPCVFLILAQ